MRTLNQLVRKDKFLSPQKTKLKRRHYWPNLWYFLSRLNHQRQMQGILKIGKIDRSLKICFLEHKD